MVGAIEVHQQNACVVVSAVVVAELARGGLVHGQLVVVVLKEGRGVEQFFHVQTGWVAHGVVHEFFVRVPVFVVRDGHLRAAKLWQDGLFNLLVRLGDVFDFFFALGLVRVHLEDTQDQVLVGDVGRTHLGFEAGPVFAFGNGLNGRGVEREAFGFKHLHHGFVRRIGTVNRQILVEADFAFRGGVRLGADAGDANAVGVGGQRNQFAQRLPIVVTLFHALHEGTVVAVVHHSRLFFGHRVLPVVFSDDEFVILEILDQVLRGHDSLAQHDGRKDFRLAFHGTSDAEFETGFVVHGWFVVDGAVVADRLAAFPAHHGRVAGVVFALIALRGERHFTAFPHQDRRGFDGRLFGEVLRRKLARDVNAHLVALEYQGIGVDVEVEFLDLFHHCFEAASGQKQRSHEN